jgi:hypothetical protein
VDEERWLYFADEHARFEPAAGGAPASFTCHGSGDDVPFAWQAETGDLSDSGMTPAPRLILVGPCSRCGMTVPVRLRS